MYKKLPSISIRNSWSELVYFKLSFSPTDKISFILKLCQHSSVSIEIPRNEPVEVKKNKKPVDVPYNKLSKFCDILF